MREAFVRTLCDLAQSDDRIVLLTGDLGFLALEPFRLRFPQRFINVGVAEQNMIGIATGMAEAGMLPYCYSIATFASLRAFEFIRNGPVHHRLSVRVVGMGMGFEYGHAGATHYAVEDVAALRTLPEMAVVIPADGGQTETAIRATAFLDRSVYYSLGKDDRAVVQGLDGRFQLGKLQSIREGGDVAIVSMGSVTVEAVAAVCELESRGVRAGLAVLSNFSPDPVEDLAELLARVRHVVSVEAQAASGGLAALIATVIAGHGLRCRLSALAVRESPDGTSGTQQDRWRKYGLDRSAIVEAAMRAMGAAS